MDKKISQFLNISSDIKHLEVKIENKNMNEKNLETLKKSKIGFLILLFSYSIFVLLNFFMFYFFPISTEEYKSIFSLSIGLYSNNEAYYELVFYFIFVQLLICSLLNLTSFIISYGLKFTNLIKISFVIFNISLFTFSIHFTLFSTLLIQFLFYFLSCFLFGTQLGSILIRKLLILKSKDSELSKSTLEKVFANKKKEQALLFNSILEDKESINSLINLCEKNQGKFKNKDDLIKLLDDIKIKALPSETTALLKMIYNNNNYNNYNYVENS